jgi:hypothetical protein
MQPQSQIRGASSRPTSLHVSEDIACMYSTCTWRAKRTAAEGLRSLKPPGQPALFLSLDPFPLQTSGDSFPCPHHGPWPRSDRHSGTTQMYFDRHHHSYDQIQCVGPTISTYHLGARLARVFTTPLKLLVATAALPRCATTLFYKASVPSQRFVPWFKDYLPLLLRLFSTSTPPDINSSALSLSRCVNHGHRVGGVVLA